MRAGDVVRCDFGTPARGEPGFVRPAIVVTSDEVLEFRQHAIADVLGLDRHFEEAGFALLHGTGGS